MKALGRQLMAGGDGGEAARHWVQVPDLFPAQQPNNYDCGLFSLLKTYLRGTGQVGGRMYTDVMDPWGVVVRP
jgi:hypothetical protein